MTDEQFWNEYLIPGTDVLINKLNINDKDELNEVEKLLTRKSLAKLYLDPVEGNFDMEHLKKIHERIFKDIYPFAGKFRKCTLQKDDHIFCNPNQIEPLLNEILEKMNKEFEEEIYSSTEFAFFTDSITLIKSAFILLNCSSGFGSYPCSAERYSFLSFEK